MQDPTTWLGKGLLMVQQGGANIQRAQYQFNNVINTQSDNIGALLAAGNVAYLSKNYREALAKYRKVRAELGIGHWSALGQSAGPAHSDKRSRHSGPIGCFLSFPHGPSANHTAYSFLRTQALQLNAACPAEIRLGMGLCFFKLKMYEKARVAFQACCGAPPATPPTPLPSFSLTMIGPSCADDETCSWVRV
jgi:tetratricopeptide (TPR) repeat protein